ncbi:MAG TPA: M20 family metallopeptidase [Propionibacteriaceae bacterium]|nr:M20 family metallopeptidase [Propionibacteriaceae bacterium]
MSTRRLDVLDIARELVRTPSPNPPGDERAAAELVRVLLPELHLPRARTITRHESRPNLLITLDFGPGGRHLVLSGHLDTKPVADATWSVDPFGADVEGDRLYGLGSADMKSALAAMLVAASRLASDAPSRGRLSLLFTADEENGSAYGAHHVAQSVPLHADGVVIGEPGGIDEDYDRLHLVSRGIARLRLVAYGRQGHSSLSDELGTRNAGVDAARLVTEIADSLAVDTPENVHGLSGWTPTVNTGMAYRGGVGFGVLPGVMAVDTEVRLLPGMRRETVSEAFTVLAERVSQETGSELRIEFDQPPNDWLPATLVAPSDPLVEEARAACRAVLGTEPTSAVFPGTTDATWFNVVQGLPPLPALGPGLLRRAHAADEWVSIQAVRQAVEIYTHLARAYCSGDAIPAAHEEIQR